MERTTNYQPEQEKKLKKIEISKRKKKTIITFVTAVKKKSLSLPQEVVM